MILYTNHPASPTGSPLHKIASSAGQRRLWACVNPSGSSGALVSRRQAFWFGFFIVFLPIVPCQPSSRSNFADPGVLLGSVPCLLSCPSANDPTSRPFGPASQALNMSGLHSVSRVPFFPPDVDSAFIYFCCFPSHPCARWPRSSCFRRPKATGIS